MRVWVLALVGCICASADTLPITDPNLRLEALRAVFPGMKISTEQREDSQHRVAGPAINEAERCASEDILSGSLSKDRLVELTLFPWPREGGNGLLAVVQYVFDGASPAASCWSLGELIHLKRSTDGWHAKDRYLLNTVHHTSIPSALMIDLTGRGIDYFAVESNTGWAGSGAVSIQVFDLGRSSFAEILNVYSHLESEIEENYTQTLDVVRTRRNAGRLFCFEKSTQVEKGVVFEKPRLSKPCYRPGLGVDPRRVKERSEWLRPLQAPAP
jgi:hypothetical protein